MASERREPLPLFYNAWTAFGTSIPITVRASQ